MSPLTLVTLLCVVPAGLAGWQNDWDMKHKAQCGGGEYVTRVRSYHSNSKEDRRWEITCGREARLRADKDCAWTDYVNSYDDIMSFSCPGNKVITGMTSDHSNGKEDRRFKFLCCGIYAEPAVCTDGTFGARCQFQCQCAGGEVCDKVNGTCPSGCTPGRYGPGCQLDSKCYYSDNKARYQGNQNSTVSGKACQRWELDVPQRHRYKQKCDFADGELPENFCRTTLSDADTDPWCYTTDPNTRWEYCGVEACQCPVGRYGEDCAKECHCALSLLCDRETGKCALGDCELGWGGEGCQVRMEPRVNSCYLTDFVNDWDKAIDWRAPHRGVVTGAFSYHSNSKEDRRWKFYVCQM